MYIRQEALKFEIVNESLAIENMLLAFIIAYD